jgi:phospholipid transport system substrate-binding protein
MRKILTFFLFSIIFISNTNISLSIEPDIFIQSTVNRAASTLGGDLSKEERIEELKKIAIDTVDINGIGLYSLGSHRKNLNKDQLLDYKTVFREYFLKSFSSRLAEYSNPEIEVISKNIINKNYTIVLSKLVGTDSRPEVKIEWRVYTKNPDNLLIRDLIIEGLSLARTQKEEFNSIINSNNGDIEALLKSLTDFSSQ